MTNGLNKQQIKFLTYIVWILILFISGATGYLLIENAKLSDRFVRLERYKQDTQRLEESSKDLTKKFDSFSIRIEDKLDEIMDKIRNK